MLYRSLFERFKGYSEDCLVLLGQLTGCWDGERMPAVHGGAEEALNYKIVDTWKPSELVCNLCFVMLRE